MTSNYRLPNRTHLKLRRISRETKISMNQFVVGFTAAGLDMITAKGRQALPKIILQARAALRAKEVA